MTDRPTRLRITHDTRYSYSSSVSLTPHYFRFGLRPASYLTVENFELEIDPKPLGRRQLIDEEGNAIAFCWFAGQISEMTIRAQSTIVSHEYNPFAFLLYPASFNRLPFAYGPSRSARLAACLAPLDVSAELTAFGEAILAETSGNTLGYLSALTDRIHERCEVVYRADGAPRPGGETFALASGSCRDLSWMMIALLRTQGVAARFTSGYLYLEPDDPSDTPAYELHAWVEVFLPGGGWFGLDPSQGVVAGNGHLAIVSSAHYANTMPVSGGIAGDGISTLTTELEIVRV